jgi:hypothetical protein
MFRCRHSKTTWPQTGREPGADAHVTCVDCGAEFQYDWEAMKRGPRIDPRPAPTARVVQPEASECS